MDNIDSNFYENLVFPVRGRVLSSDSILNYYFQRGEVNQQDMTWRKLEGVSRHNSNDKLTIRDDSQFDVKYYIILNYI
jgi:hypothetical protein